MARVCLLLAAAALAAQSGKRIELPPKGPAVTLDGDVAKGKDVVYIFQAKGGQKFNGRITKKAGNVGFGVTGPDGNGLPEEEYDFNTALTASLEKTGDYRIAVATFETGPTHYTLVVRVY